MNDILIVNGQQIDLDSSLAFPLNYSISDIKEPQKRKRNLSKSLKIPGTQSNIEFFSSTYQLSLTDFAGDDVGFSFDPSQRVSAKYYKNSLLVFDGLFQLNDVVLNDKYYTFNATLFSNFIDLFMKLGDIKVGEMNWSEYNHQLTPTIVKNSFATSVIRNGAPISNFTAGVPQGFGYVYPLIDYGFNAVPSTFAINNMIPLVYCKEVFEKCMELTDTSIISTFLSTDLFKKLVLGYEGGKQNVFTPSQLTARAISLTGIYDQDLDIAGIRRVYNDGSVLYQYANQSTYNLLSDPNFAETIISDPTTQYDAATGHITINNAGTYAFNFNGTISRVLNNPNLLTFSGGFQNLVFKVKKNNIDVYTIQTGVQDDSNFDFVLSEVVNVSCNSGDVLDIVLISYTGLYYDEGTINTINIQNVTNVALSLGVNCINATILDGDTVELSANMPLIKCTDFVGGIIKAFNLYLSDPDINGAITIEPLADYYKPTSDFLDWSDVIDYSNEVKIIPSSNIEGKNYLFRFEEEEDYYNTQYKQDFGGRYGNKKYVVQSTFQTGDRDYLLPFGQAVPVEETTSNLVMPSIKKLMPNNTFEPYKGKPKIYFYNGLKTGSFRLTNVAGTSFSDETSYPCVHHSDNFENPTFDFNWELPKNIYYGTSSSIVTTANLFSIYHEKFIKEITGRDSKIIECKAKLNAKDINNLDFSRLIMINGVLFRLNEVKEFDSDKTDSTSIELVRIIEADSPVTKGIIGIGKIGIGIVNGGTYPSGGSHGGDKGNSVISGGYKGVGIKVETIKGK